jgi:ATP-binding cassette subfamily B protein
MGGGGMRGMGMRRSDLMASEEEMGKAFEWRLMKRLLSYITPYKKKAAIGVGAMIFYQIAHNLQPAIIGLGIDKIRVGDTNGLMVMVGIYLVTMFVAWMGQFMQVYQMTWAGQHALYQVASDMFNHIVKLSLSFFDRNETGRIMARVQNDVTVLQNLLSSGLVATLGNLLSLVFVIVLMFSTNWKLAAITSTVIPLFALILVFWQGFARKAFREARATISLVNASLQENVSGVRVIQSLGREARNSRQFDEANTANLEANLGASRVSAATQPIVEIIQALALALVVFFGGSMAIDGELSTGALVAFTLYVQRFFEPIRMLTQEYNMLQRASVAAERIFEILDTKSEVVDAPDAYDLRQLEGRVTYDHVDFAYVPGVDVLRDFNLDINAGERVAFVGQTGAGKSTIISLLMRFYDVTGGAIRVDGHDLRNVTMRSLRRQIGIVLQEPVLFSGTVAHNIRYANPDATDSEVVEAAKAVGAHEFIERMEHGYETLVNERGVGLSIGERQLIAFARALLANPRILILDEATANLDTTTELVVQRGIQELTRGRTALMIAHRLSTIRDADRIVVLERGRIVEEGKHDDLIALGGLYYRLYSLGFQQAAPTPANGASTGNGAGGRRFGRRPSSAGA